MARGLKGSQSVAGKVWLVVGCDSRTLQRKDLLLQEVGSGEISVLCSPPPFPLFIHSRMPAPGMLLPTFQDRSSLPQLNLSGNVLSDACELWFINIFAVSQPS